MKSLKQFLIESNTIINGGFNIARSQMPQIDDQESFLHYLDNEKITWCKEVVSNDDIKPTQINIDLDKVNMMQVSEKPIILSSDNFILDGHHRFYRNVMGLVPFTHCIVVNMSINKLLALAQDFLSNE